MLLGAVLGRALAAIGQTFSTIDTTAAGVTAGAKYTGAAVVGDRLYFGPYCAHNVGMVDTTTGTFSTIGDTSAAIPTYSCKYLGAAALGTKIYFAPSQENNVGVLDTTTSIFSTIADTTVAGVATNTTAEGMERRNPWKYNGAAAVGSKIYFTPNVEDSVGVLDTTTSTFSTINVTVAGVTQDFKFSEAAVVGTKIYFAPLMEESVGVVDTTTSTFSTIDTTAAGVVDGKAHYISATALGTKVYFGPRGEDNVGVLDTTTSIFSTIADTTVANVSSGNYRGAAAVGTSIYFAPYAQNNTGVLDTTTSTFSTIDTTAAGVVGTNKYNGAAAVGSSAYFVPFDEDNVGVLILPTSSSSAGDDPTFIGADGLPYEVRGEPWKYFNLLSTPRLSLNAQFLPVPERFVHGKITDTVLGTLHLALCDAPRSRIVGATFDVFNGAMGCTVRPPGEELGSSEQAPCAEVLPMAGATVTTEPGMCNMATMECGFVPPELNLTASMETNPALVRVHMVRYNVSVFGTNLSLVRDVVDRPEPTEDLGCSLLWTTWNRARRACETLRGVLRGESPLAAWLALHSYDRVATLARAASGNRTRQLRFYNALVEALPFAQRDVHGLLGQRSVSPAPMRAMPTARPSPLGALAMPTAQLQEASAGGSSAGTMQVAIGADGHHQGEGAIEGSYRDYQVRYVSSHGPDAHKHSRFVCGAAAGTVVTGVS